MEKGLITNIEQVYTYINDLKNSKRRYVTNIFNFEEIEYKLRYSKVLFECDGNTYLNLLCEDNGFYRLFFFIVDLDHYQLGKVSHTVVCDVFTMQENELFRQIRSKLCGYAFIQYDCIERWVLKPIDISAVAFLKGYVFDYEKNINAIESILDIFDKYTDYLPEVNGIEDFFKDKKFINAYETEGRRYVGSLIYSERKRLITLEFYFVNIEQRGKGLGYLLHDHFYQLVAKRGYKIISYVHENNLASIAIHKKYGYQKDSLRKYTFINFGT